MPYLVRIGLLVVFAGGVLGAAAPPLRTIADAPIDGPTERFDYESLDPARGLLFIADLARSRVVVFDTNASRVVKMIGGISSPHGILAVSALGRVYVSATGTDEVAVIDEAKLEVIARVPAGRYPDGIAWDARHRKLYVSDEHGASDTVIDTATNIRLGAVPLGGDVGNTQYDATDGRIYVAQQSANELVAIDPQTDTVLARHRLSGCRGAHGLQLDEVRGLAYIACQDNASLITFDLRRNAQTGRLGVGADPDVLALDVSRARLYVACESGAVSVYDVRNRRLTKIAEWTLAVGAHVVMVDQHTHRLYFPLRDVNGRSVLRIMVPR